MILKDSSPFNFTFINHRCLMIDTSSFDFFEEPSSWNAYLQFCEEILSPFALMHFNSSIWGRLTQSYLTGLPLEFVSKELSWRSHFNLTCLMHIHWHAKFKYKKEKEISNSKITKKGFSKEQLKNLWEQIFTNIQSWDNKELKNRNWDEYYDHQIESILYLEEKEKVISEWLLELKPEITIDLGANTGKFSFIAAKYSKNVFALESDIICVDQIFEKTRKLPSNNITVIAADIVEPSPALGWANAEKPALSKRLKGDMLLSLALIHHLSIGRNVPLNFIAAEFSNITSNYAIVEFIPKTDKQLKSLLESKEDIYYNYSEEFFTETFLKYFKLIKVYSFQDSARKLFLWQK